MQKKRKKSRKIKLPIKQSTVINLAEAETEGEEERTYKIQTSAEQAKRLDYHSQLHFISQNINKLEGNKTKTLYFQNTNLFRK